MTSPPPYVITRDYSDYQAAHQLPGPAIAGSDLDSEFNNLVVTTNAIINNLNLLQRSDGALNNQSVTPDTINSALAIMIAGWNIRGPWVTATVYALKDYVTNGGNGYVCIIANTGGTFATDLAAGKWALVATQGNPGAQGIPGATGPTGPVVPMYRNRLINGDFAICQRNAPGIFTNLTVNGPRQYVLDRWYARNADSSGGSIFFGSVTGSGNNQWAGQFFGGGSTNLSTTLGQCIESFNCTDLNNQNVCVSATIYSSQVTQVTWTSYRAGSADNWGSRVQLATGTITISPTPTIYNFTFNCGTSARNGVSIEFTTGPILNAGTTLSYENVQLELGTTPTAFERRLHGPELMMCQRYYNKSYDENTAPGTATRLGMVAAGSVAGAAITGYASVSFPTAMRATPSSVNLWDGAGTSNKASCTTSSTPGATTMNDNNTPAVVFNPSTKGFMFSPVANASTSFQHYSVDTEL